ncbi:MAG: sensor histidine kinase [Clostridia bacterium]|nr:sensor histidine kinase [Clostridia bacterium]
MMLDRFKFRTQLYICFVVIIAFIISAMLGMMYLIQRNSYRLQESSVLEANSRQVAINIDNRLDYYLSYLQILSTDRSLIRTMETQPFERVRQELESVAAEYMRINVGRLNGIRIYTNGEDMRADGLGDIRSIFAEFVPGSSVYRNNLLITGTYLNARNEKVFSLFQKVFQTNTEREYILEMRIYETELLGFFCEDDSGNFIAVFTDDRLLSVNSRYTFAKLLYDAKRQAELGIGRERLDIPKPITITSATKKGVNVMIGTDTDYLDRTYRTIVLRMALVTAVVAALAFFIVWQISMRLTRRIGYLSDKIADISNWKLEREINIRGQDEFSLLAAELDETRRRILALIEQVNHTNLLKRAAEVSALRAQINSHFLFNALSSIKWLSKRNDHEQLNIAVDHLAAFLRYSLSLKEDTVPLKLELEHLRAYTYLQKLRYGDEVNVHTDVSEELWDCKTLKLLLQPLVENAIYHGRREDGSPLNITIYSAAANGSYDLIVEDDGNGMSEERIQSILADTPGEQRGYGLHNVISRLRMCQKNAGLTIESEPGICTRVIINQPV